MAQLPNNHGRERVSSEPPSKALPIVVAAGLAVGVFGGLVIMNGPGGGDAAAHEVSTAAADGGPAVVDLAATDSKPPVTVANAQDPGSGDTIITRVTQTADAAPVQVPTAKPELVASITADASVAEEKSPPEEERSAKGSGERRRRAHSGRPPKGESGTNLDVALTPSVFADESPGRSKTVTIRFDVSPRVQDLRITVNGEEVTNASHRLRLSGRAKKVRVTANARGFRPWNRSYTISRDQTIRIRMQRPSVVDSPGGLIDL